MDDFKKRILDLIISAVVVFVVVAVLLPLLFPRSAIDPFGIGEEKKVTENVDVVRKDKQAPEKENFLEKKKSKVSEWLGSEKAKKSMRTAAGALGALAFLASAGYATLYAVRLSMYRSRAMEMAYFKVIPASDFKIPNIAYAKYFLINMAKHLKSPWDSVLFPAPWCRIVYKKKMDDGNVEMVIGVPKDRTDGFINSFKAYYARAQLIEYFEIYEDADGNRYRITSPTELLDNENYGVAEFRLKFSRGDKKLHPIAMYTGKSDEMDPLEAILAAMGAGEVDMDEVIVDVTLRPVWSKYHLYDRGKKYMEKIRGMSEEGAAGFLEDTMAELFQTKSSKMGKRPVTEFAKMLIQQLKTKCSPPEKAYSTNVRVYVKCKNPEHTIMRMKGVIDGFDALGSYNELEAESHMKNGSLWHRIYLGYPHPMRGMILSTAELVSFVRVPDSSSPMFSFFDHNDTMAIRAPAGFWEDDTVEYMDMD